MKKYGSPEKLTVFTGEEVNVVDKAFQKTGKTAVSDFNEEELDELQTALDGLKGEEDVEEVAPKTTSKKTVSKS